MSMVDLCVLFIVSVALPVAVSVAIVRIWLHLHFRKMERMPGEPDRIDAGKRTTDIGKTVDGPKRML